ADDTASQRDERNLRKFATKCFREAIDREWRVSIHTAISLCVSAPRGLEQLFVFFEFGHETENLWLFVFESGLGNDGRARSFFNHNLPSFRCAISSRDSEIEIIGT